MKEISVFLFHKSCQFLIQKYYINPSLKFPLLITPWSSLFLHRPSQNPDHTPTVFKLPLFLSFYPHFARCSRIFITLICPLKPYIISLFLSFRRLLSILTVRMSSWMSLLCNFHSSFSFSKRKFDQIQHVRSGIFCFFLQFTQFKFQLFS